MTELENPIVLATPSRWPYRIAYILSVAALIGGIWSWVELSNARQAREAVLLSVDAAEQNGADNKVLRNMMKSYREAGSEVSSWQRRRLGLFLAFVILLIGGFIGTGLVNLHDKMQWQVREIKTLADDDYGGH